MPSPGEMLPSAADRIWRTSSVREVNVEAIWRLLRGAAFDTLLIRTSSDPIFNLLGGDAGGASMGVGALFNVLAIASSIPPLLYAFVDIARGVSDLDEFRLQSTFSHANIYAFYLGLVLGLGLYVRSSQIVQVSGRVRTLVTLYLPLLMMFLLLTKTRSAWGVCGVMFLVYALRIDRRFLAGLLLVPVIFIVNPSLMDRLTDVTAATEVDSFSQLNDSNRLNSYVWRQALWESAIPEVLEQPVLGHGLESFKPATPSFFPLVSPEGIDGHNFYLQMSFELGLLGFLALIWLLGCVAWCLAKGLRRVSRKDCDATRPAC
ncbi:O-antigen ligase family protein [Bosea sp. AS-1]|uniref:O-antigen ligase family protein n=1 Tax=Bosea sp. AS-1 TaxID=2015316 RepID=UPI000B77E940|nr:O-antigen ligase family protein [Bosea sp. AS-1]